MNSNGCVRALCALPLALAAAGTRAADWSVEWMPAFGGPAVEVWDLNDRGELIGLDPSGPYNSTSRTFLYSGGTLTELSGVLGLGATVSGINNHGQITGTVGDNVYRYDRGALTVYHLDGVRDTSYEINSRGQILVSSIEPERQNTFVIDRNGRVTTIGPAEGDTGASAVGLNDRGEVAGTLRTYGVMGSQAYVHRRGEMTLLMPHVQSTSAAGISQAGHVAFNYGAPGGHYRAAIWHDGVVTDLGTLGGGNSLVYDVNSAGEAIGSSATATGDATFLYSYGSMINLTALVGGTRVFPRDINDQGVVVGTYQPLGTSDLHLFAYVDGQVIDVTRWLMASFSDIASVGNWYNGNLQLNDVGQLAATARMRDGSTRVFIVSSVPEPALGLMLLLGLVPLAALRRRRE